MSRLPRYRLGKGRPLGDNKSLDPGLAHRMLGLRFPLDLFERMYEDLRDHETAMAISGVEPGYASDYVRASVLLLSLLLEGPTRERTLAWLQLPEDKQARVLSHLVYRFALPEGEALHAEMFRQQEGVDPTPEGEAPLTDNTPWDQL